MSNSSHPLSELMITACAEAWRDAGEIMVTGIGPIPRIAAGLAKHTFSPAIQITDGEAWYTSEPLPLGQSHQQPVYEGPANYDRVFSTLWSGKRHAMVTPVQIDRYGQANISVIGDHKKPRTAMLGVRGFPGNSICHPNSFFFPKHNKRVFVEGEVDFVCMAGYNPDRYPRGQMPKGLDLRLIVTELCVLDFGGTHHSIRIRSLHPGVTFDEVQDNTGFSVTCPSAPIPTTCMPTPEQLAIISQLDPEEKRNRS